MLQVEHITKYYGGKKVLDNVNFHIKPREKVGLVGVNGSGKTTLLKIIEGSIGDYEGKVLYSSSISTSILSQEVNVKPENTLYNEMREALPDVLYMEKRLREVEEEMSKDSLSPEVMEELILEYSELMEKFDSNNGCDIDWKIDKVIQGLGFKISDKERLVSEFSGGWQMRIQLAKLLLKEKELLLLDEPTNHLDLKAIEWLENYLKEYPATLIIVSHDRYFLNRVTTKTLYLDKGKIKVYSGNYNSFITIREQEREALEKSYKNQQKKIEQDKRFIERFRYKATLASRVKSREKMIDKMDKIDAPQRLSRNISFSFAEKNKDMTLVYELKGLEKEYPGKTVSLKGEIEIFGEDRIALMGDNGSGKTTLLRILAGIDGSFKGKIKVHPNAEISYYLQNHSEQLNLENSVLEQMRLSAPSDFSTEALRTILGAFLFRNEDVFKKISQLSGGEKSRLAIATIVCNPSNILLLDEPTNHLDFESREVLAKALNKYKGTIIVISHDRYFIQQICKRVIDISKGNLVNYIGDYEYYKEKKESFNKVSLKIGSPDRKKRKTSNKRNKNIKETKKSYENPGKIRDDIVMTEELISSLEQKLKNIEAKLEEPQYASDNLKLCEILDLYNQVKDKIEKNMVKWEEMHKKLERIS